MTEDELYSLSDEELEKAYKDSLKQEEENTENDLQEEKEEVENENNENNEEITTESTKPDEEGVEQVSEPIKEEEVAVAEEEPPTPNDNLVEEPTNNEITYKIKANGQEFDFTLDELKMLAPKAMDYTKKTQALAPYRRTIQAMEENGISPKDINLFIDMKKGNKEAFVSFMKEQNIDAFDLPDESHNYVPNEYGKDPSVEQRDMVLKEIAEDRENLDKVKGALDNLDPESKSFLFRNPNLLKGLHIDVKNGMYDKLMPQAIKYSALDGNTMPILEYYKMASIDYANAMQQAQAREEAMKNEKLVKTAKAKKEATLPTTSGKVEAKQILNYADIDDDDYNRWYKNKVENRY